MVDFCTCDVLLSNIIIDCFLCFSIFLDNTRSILPCCLKFVIELLQKKDVLIKMPSNLYSMVSHKFHVIWANTSWPMKQSQTAWQDLKQTHLLCNRAIVLSTIYYRYFWCTTSSCVFMMCLSMEILSCLPLSITAMNCLICCRANAYLCLQSGWDEFMTVNM